MTTLDRVHGFDIVPVVQMEWRGDRTQEEQKSVPFRSRRRSGWRAVRFLHRMTPWRWFGLFSGVLIFFLVAFVPSGLHRIEGFGHRPARAAAVAALMVVWWLTEALPIAVTACVPVVLFPLLGVYGQGLAGDMVRSIEPFTDAYIFLFMGGMAIGAAMEQWNLHRRVALHILLAIGTEPRRLLLGMSVATATVSLWISNTATAVMMVPIGMALVRQLEASEGGRRLEHFGSAVMLSIAYASNVGGIGTKIGTATNSIFAGFVADKLGVDIGFLQYMAIGLPFVVLFTPVMYGTLWRLGRRDVLGQVQGRAVLEQELAAMGKMSSGERKVAVVFAVAALLWIAGGPVQTMVSRVLSFLGAGVRFQAKHYEAVVAMAAALSLAAVRGLPWDALRRVPWSMLVLLGGSFAMASGIEGSGLSGWMARRLAVVSTLPLFLQIGLAALATVSLSAVASNTATINVVLNVLPPSVPLLSAAAIAASCDFMLPAGTPPNAIVFGSGYVRLPTMMKTGFALDLAAVVLVAVYSYFYVRHVVG